jgi:hypothetical protein
MEAPSTTKAPPSREEKYFVANERVSQYSAEVIIFESWTGSSLPAEVVRIGRENLSEAPVGVYTHGTMIAKIKNPKLWSAEKVYTSSSPLSSE